MNTRLIFEPREREKVVNTMIETWDQFRDNLSNSKFLYDDIYKAKEEGFLEVFDNMFTHTFSLSEKTIKSLNHTNSFCRAVKPQMEETVTLNRFVPDATKGLSNNRFSPPGVEWLYLAMDFNDTPRTQIKGNFNDIENCCLSEIKANKADRVALCYFSILPKCIKIEKRFKVVDLTIADNKTYEELNAILTMATNDNYVKASYEWFINTYMKMLSTNIFKPVTVNEKEEYYPFQCLAKYFESKGYVGIVYRSTVYDKGKNIVLFSKKFAFPIEPIRDEIF